MILARKQHTGGLMPHLNLKLYKGRTEEQKKKLTEEIVKNVTNILGVDEKYVSVSIQDFETEEWNEKVFQPDIVNQQERLYKKPNYTP